MPLERKAIEGSGIAYADEVVLTDTRVGGTTVRALARQGIYTVGDARAASYETLAMLVGGRSRLATLMEAIGRSAEYNKRVGHYDVNVIQDGEVIASYPSGMIRQLSGLMGTARYFGFGSGAELKQGLKNGWRTNLRGERVPFSEEDIAAYKHRSDTARAIVGGNYGRKRGEAQVLQEDLGVSENAITGSGDGNAIDEWRTRVEDAARAYAQDYDTRLFSRTDWENLRILAGMKLRVAQLQAALGMLDSTSSAALAKAASEMAREVSETSREIRQLEDALGVSVRARLAQQQEKKLEDIWGGFMERAKQFMAKEATIIRCPRCSEQREGIRLAVFVPHFPRHILTSMVRVRCPRCGHEFEADLVTDEQRASYVEAGDFEPAGMPEAIKNELGKRK